MYLRYFIRDSFMLIGKNGKKFIVFWVITNEREELQCTIMTVRNREVRGAYF